MQYRLFRIDLTAAENPLRVGLGKRGFEAEGRTEASNGTARLSSKNRYKTV